MKALVASILLFPALSLAQNCDVKVNMGSYYSKNPSKSMVRSIGKVLKKKGYKITKSNSADYSLEVSHAYEITDYGSFPAGTQMTMMNSGLQIIAEGHSETYSTSSEVMRTLFGLGMSVNSSTKKALSKLGKSLPVCR
jgi:hypothetical protein